VNTDDRHQFISAGVDFMRQVMAHYGQDKGTEVWDKMCEAMDPQFKGEVLFAMLTGEITPTITVKPYQYNHRHANKVLMIKTVREVSGLSLKEAKDLVDNNLDNMKEFKLKCHIVKDRDKASQMLRAVDLNV
jgi:hypothetical protein